MAHKILEEVQEMNDLLINKMENRSSSNSRDGSGASKDCGIYQ